jgi:hypothetical protein
MATRATDVITCEFCGGQICEFFKDVDASQFIRSAVVSHFAYCRQRSPDFVGDVVIVYAGLLVEAYKRRRELRNLRDAARPRTTTAEE